MNCPPPALLMVAFGGPTPGCCERFTPCPGEAHCFVSGILGHNPARRQRIAEVAAHYEAFGGYSEFNAHTRAQAAALAAELRQRPWTLLRSKPKADRKVPPTGSRR